MGRRWAHSRTPTPAGEGNGYHQECQGGTGRENGARSPSRCKGKSEEPRAALPAASQTQCPFPAAEGPRCPDLRIPLIPRDGQQEERPSLWADAPAFPLRPGGIRRPDPISLGTAFSPPSSSPSSTPRVKSQGTLTPPARSPGGSLVQHLQCLGRKQKPVMSSERMRHAGVEPDGPGWAPWTHRGNSVPTTRISASTL